jgi:hypothetical protein
MGQPRFRRHPEDALSRVLVAGFEQTAELFAFDAILRQFGPQVVTTAFEAVGNVLEEQQAEDNVLVLRGIDLPTERVSGLPKSVGVVQVAGHYVIVRHQSSVLPTDVNVPKNVVGNAPNDTIASCWPLFILPKSPE